MSRFKDALEAAIFRYEILKNPNLIGGGQSSGFCGSFFYNSGPKNTLPEHRAVNIAKLRRMIDGTARDDKLLSAINIYIASDKFYTGFKVPFHHFSKGSGVLLEYLNEVLSDPAFSKDQLIVNELCGGDSNVPGHLRQLKGLALYKALAAAKEENLVEIKESNSALRIENNDLLEVIRGYIHRKAYGNDETSELVDFLVSHGHEPYVVETPTAISP